MASAPAPSVGVDAALDKQSLRYNERRDKDAQLFQKVLNAGV
jgi:hypothetical protein